VPRGTAHASKRWGRRPYAAVLEAAAQLAQDGVVLTRTQASEHASGRSLIERDSHGAEVWYPGGRQLVAGERFTQPHLADAIERIGASLGESLHVGDLAHRLVAWADEAGARITREDLASYEVHERVPRSLQVGDVVMHANPAPAMGGEIGCRLLERMLHGLAMLDATSRASAARRDRVVAHALLDVLGEVDPPRTRCPQPGEHVTTAHMHIEGAVLLSRDTPHAVLGWDAPPQGLSRSASTTHVSAIDSDGLVAGATTTIGFGSGVFVPGTGIQLNNMLAEYDYRIQRPPGTPIPSMMTPVILQSPRTLAQLGSAGSDRIPQALSQILERLWHGAALADAIEAPRIAWDGATLHAEPGFDRSVLDELVATSRVTNINEWSGTDPYFGTTNAVGARGGELAATGDPRREAVGMVVPR
jgi:gamma-glutamyltranspeptidase/glutathione hydrolase